MTSRPSFRICRDLVGSKLTVKVSNLTAGTFYTYSVHRILKNTEPVIGSFKTLDVGKASFKV